MTALMLLLYGFNPIVLLASCVALAGLNIWLWSLNIRLFLYKRNLAHRRMVVFGGYAKAMFGHQAHLFQVSRMVNVLRKRERRAKEAKARYHSLKHEKRVA